MTRINHDLQKDADKLNEGVQKVDTVIQPLPQPITNEQIDEEIIKEKVMCLQFPETTATVACVPLKDGSFVIGSCCLPGEDAQKKAIMDARIKISDIIVEKLCKEVRDKINKSRPNHGLRINKKGEIE